jgi:hypothetical protein
MHTKKKLQISVGKKIVFAFAGSILGLCVVEGFATGAAISLELWTQWSERPKVVNLREESHCQYDEELGWINKPDTTIADFYGPGLNISINHNGLRGVQDFDPDSQHYKIICLGDSFTLGYGVGDQQTIPYHLQQQFDGRNSSGQYGQGGYSIGQSWLWLKRAGPDLKPDLVCAFSFLKISTASVDDSYCQWIFHTTDLMLLKVAWKISNVPVPPKLERGHLPAGSYTDS